jgi:Astacin (Peptidase family M12A)
MTTNAVLLLAVACPPACVAPGAFANEPGSPPPVVASNARRWSHGRIPYSFAPDVSDLLRARVDSAVWRIEARASGVTFTPRARETDYVEFRPGAQCSTDAEGREQGESVVWLSDNCLTGGVMHELVHVLGLWHEQGRCDRDQYVSIIWANIEPTKLAREQFAKRCSSTGDREEYDEASIMHYPDTAFAAKRDANGALLKTMESRRGRGYLMGQRDSLSTIDIRTINDMYPPNASPTTASR